MKKIYFVNGMPRSGSTLLCNVLAQNPDFHTTSTSSLSEIISIINAVWKTNPIIRANEAPEKQLNIIQGLFESYHSDTMRPIVFNKSRGWVANIELVENALQKEIKIIVTTRKITCILASFEKIYRKELKLISSPMERKNSLETIESRVIHWTSPEGMVGGTFNAIRDAVMRGHKNKMLFIDFDDLTQYPKSKLEEIYDFLQQPYFKHDFNNIQQYTSEKDSEYGLSELHNIRNKIEPVLDDSKQILGPIWQQFEQYNYNF